MGGGDLAKLTVWRFPAGGISPRSRCPHPSQEKSSRKQYESWLRRQGRWGGGWGRETGDIKQDRRNSRTGISSVGSSMPCEGGKHGTRRLDFGQQQGLCSHGIRNRIASISSYHRQQSPARLCCYKIQRSLPAKTGRTSVCPSGSLPYSRSPGTINTYPNNSAREMVSSGPSLDGSSSSVQHTVSSVVVKVSLPTQAAIAAGRHSSPPSLIGYKRLGLAPTTFPRATGTGPEQGQERKVKSEGGKQAGEIIINTPGLV